MPAGFLLAADFGAVIVALFATLLAIAVYLVVRGIATILPNISILGVGINLKDWFENAGDDVANWIVSTTKSMWVHIATLLYATAYIFDKVFLAIVHAIDHAFDYADHIVTVTIPREIGVLADSAAHDLATAVKGVESDITASANKIEGILTGDVKTIYSTISTDVGNLEGDITRSVAAGVVKAEDFATGEVADLRNYVNNEISTAEGIAAAATTALAKTLGSKIAQVATDASNALSAAETTLEADIRAAAQTAASNLAAAETTIGSEISSVANTAATEVASAEAAAKAEVGALGAQLESTITSDVGALTNDIAGTAQALEGDLSNLDVVLKAAIAASIAGVVARVAKLEECSVGVCSDSPNNFGSLLQAALGFAEVAGVGAFLAEIIQHPKAATNDYSSLIASVYSGGQSLLDDILSL